MKKLAYWAVLLVVLYVVLELVSAGGLVLLEKFRHARYEPVDRLSKRQNAVIEDLLAGKSRYVAFSPTLGWSIKPNGASELYRANAAGLRSDREHALVPAEGARRIATFGDSFTHCDDVGNAETWQAFMEAQDPRTEVINFGVGGFGLDQAYLRYLELGRQYGSEIVLIGYMPENVQRHVNVFRPFYAPETMLPLAKPRFKIEQGALRLVPNPMQNLEDYRRLLDRPRETMLAMSTEDHHYKKRYVSTIFEPSPTARLIKIFFHEIDRAGSRGSGIEGFYVEGSEALAVTQKIFDEFRAAVLADGARPVIVILPNEMDVRRQQRKGKKVYSSLLSYFESSGYEYVDLMETLEDTSEDDFVGHHYSPATNRRVARYLLDSLDGRGRPLSLPLRSNPAATASPTAPSVNPQTQLAGA